jgi:hypothetical protein
VFVLGLSVNSLVKPWAQIPQLNIPHGAFLLPFAALFPAQLSSCLGLPFSGVTSLVILILEQFTCLLLCSFAASEKKAKWLLYMYRNWWHGIMSSDLRRLRMQKVRYRKFPGT